MMAGQPTFQQTFANCPFPEGVLAVLGGYPVQVRVHRGQRAMEVALSGAAVSQEILSQAAEALKRAFGLSTAAVEVDLPAPEESAPRPEPSAAEESPAPEAPPLPPKAPPAAPPEAPAPKKQPPEGLEAQMKAMRRKLMSKDAPAASSKDGKKRQKKSIFGAVGGKNKPIPIGELTLDMGSVLVEGEVFNIEHRELARRKAWVVCFYLTDYTGSIRVTRFMEGEEA